MSATFPGPQLWYTRRQGVVRGPFPSAVIGSHLVIGRLHLEDEVSPNGLNWTPIRNHPALIPEVVHAAGDPDGPERLERARLREDERLDDRRRAARTEPGGRHGERRAPESARLQRSRARLGERMTAAVRAARPGYRIPLAIAAGLFVAGVLTWWRSEPEDFGEAPACGAPPAPGVNWSFCRLDGRQLAGANLSGLRAGNAVLSHADLRRANLANADLGFANLTASDLSGASLRGARLRGAVLRGARLAGAGLAGADLGYAILEGAALEGAILSDAELGHAVWIDGRTCAPGSIGRCR